MSDIKKDWITKAGLRAVVLMVERGTHHCGYVALTKEHPLFGVGYSEKHPALRWADLEGAQIGNRGVMPVFCAALKGEPEEMVAPDLYFNVHGSLTYAAKGDGYPADGDGLWWFGYDCAHAGDLRLNDRYGDREGVFRDLDYCIAECESLAEQLEAVRDKAARCAV